MKKQYTLISALALTILASMITSTKNVLETSKRKIPKLWTYIITKILTAIITFLGTILYIANRPVSFDAGACGGGFETAVFDQYADRLVADNHFYLTRDYKGRDIISISPVRDSREVKYEGKAIYMSFDIIYTFGDHSSQTEKISFVGERKWIQNYKWRIVEL